MRSCLTLKHSRGVRDPKGWDDFAQQCGACYQASYAYLRSLRWSHAIQVFEFYLGLRKVGQCAVVRPRFGLGASKFTDALFLLPEFRSLWADAMAAVLNRLGSGQYEYGSLWSTAPPCDHLLSRIPGVMVVEKEPCIVHAVDFRGWPDWDGYRRAMSSNARRNAAKAVKNDKSVRVEIAEGATSLRYLVPMLWMRCQTYRRKGGGRRGLSTSLHCTAKHADAAPQLHCLCPTSGKH
jgi:hypothetical protein